MIQPPTTPGLRFSKPHLALICVLIIPLLMGANVYRWVDENGVVNFTQQQPRDVAVQEVEVRVGGVKTSPSPAPARLPEDTGNSDATESAESDAEAQRELTQAQQQELEDLKRQEQLRQQDLAQVKAENCGKAKVLLEKLTINNRIRLRQSDGSEVALGEDDRQKRIAATQEDIAVNCVADRRSRSSTQG